MNKNTNALTAETLSITSRRLNSTQEEKSKRLYGPLRLCAFAVKSNSFISKCSATILISLSLFLLASFTHAQEIDLLLKNGHVIDPANNINARLDIGIAD